MYDLKVESKISDFTIKKKMGKAITNFPYTKIEYTTPLFIFIQATPIHPSNNFVNTSHFIIFH